MTEQQRAEVREISAWRTATAERARMTHEQGVATAQCALRGYPFSWLPREHVLNWIRKLEFDNCA